MFRQFLEAGPIDPTKIQDTKQQIKEPTSVGGAETKDRSYYFSQVDPKTGQKYRIPNLSTFSSDYVATYIKYMKMKESDPDKFTKIMNWN